MSASAPAEPAARLFTTGSEATPRVVRRRPDPSGGIKPVAAGLLHGLAVRVADAGSGGLSAVAVASVLPREGATTIACGLAACIATALGKRVVLIDANLRSPALRTVYGLERGPGLLDILGGDASVQAALRRPAAGQCGEGRLLVLPASPTAAASPAAFTPAAIRDLLADLHGYADVLLFDCAPLARYPDTALLARHLDGTALVLQAERATWHEAEQAVQDLRDSGARVLGAVLNRQRSYIPRLIARLL